MRDGAVSPAVSVFACPGPPLTTRFARVSTAGLYSRIRPGAMKIGSATNHHTCGQTLGGLRVAGFELAPQSACVMALVFPRCQLPDRNNRVRLGRWLKYTQTLAKPTISLQEHSRPELPLHGLRTSTRLRRTRSRHPSSEPQQSCQSQGPALHLPVSTSTARQPLGPRAFP